MGYEVHAHAGVRASWPGAGSDPAKARRVRARRLAHGIATWPLLGFVAFWAALADPFGVAEAMARADQQLAVRRGRQRHERGGPRRRRPPPRCLERMYRS